MSTTIALVLIASIGISLAIGALLARRVPQARIHAAERRAAELQEQVVELSTQVRTQDQMGETFAAMAANTLSGQSTQLLDQAERQWDARGNQILGELSKYAEQLRQLERERSRETTQLDSAVKQLHEANEASLHQTAELSGMLRNSSARGNWGEMQLRRILEAAGMQPHVDFVEQVSVGGNDGRLQPDVVVRMPNGRCVVVDAKAPLDHHRKAHEATDDATRQAHLRQHAEAVGRHAKALAKKDYASAVDGAVDFVVMFVPGEAILAEAIHSQPELLEDAFAAGVVLASPTTLFGLLRTVAIGWREERMAETAQDIAALGAELYDRISGFAEKFVRSGRSLESAVKAYNDAMGSMESRLLVTARRFDDLGVTTTKALPESVGLEAVPRLPSAGELTPAEEEGAA